MLTVKIEEGVSRNSQPRMTSSLLQPELPATLPVASFVFTDLVQPPPFREPTATVPRISIYQPSGNTKTENTDKK